MAIREEIAKLYDTILKRPADDVGLDYFTNAVTSGAGTLADVARDLRASAEAQGLLGGATTNTAAVTNNAATTNAGLLGGATTNTAANTGYTMDAARNLVSGFYKTGLSRAADAGGLDFWSNAIVSGQMSPADVYRAIMASPEGQGTQIGVRPVPFGSQAVGGNVYEMAQYNAPRNLPPSIQNAFQQSLDYQAALPYLIPQFNPADIPATYQQIAQPRQRLDISNITVPQWLQDAAKKDQAAAEPVEEGAEAKPVVQPATTTGGVTTTNVGSNSLDYLKNVPNWIINTYGNALGRLPEQSGAEYWAAQEKAGVPIADLIATIQSSPEALGRAGLLSK
jgi:hypothetical protein